MREILRDVRQGARMLAKNAGFTATALCTLVIGIGASTAIFSVVNAVLLQPLPYPDPQQLVGIWGVSSLGNRTSLSESTFLAYRDRNRAFAQMATFNGAGFTLTDVRNPERVRGGRVGAAFFEVLRIQPLLGRTFRSGEDVEGHTNVVVLGYGVWQRRFGSNPDIVGQTISMNKQPYTVIGVLPADFEFSVPGLFRPADLWVPAMLSRDGNNRGNYLRAIGRLKPGVTLAQGQADLEAMDRELTREHPDTRTGIGSRLLLFHDEIVGEVRAVLWILFGAVGFVLLIACANVANLQLARASVRQKELVIRAALGASRARLVQQLLTESVLLALIGGALGTLLAAWGVTVLINLAPAGLPRWHAFEIDRMVLAYALAASLISAVLFGLAPALASSSPRLNETLKAGGRAAVDGPGGNRFRGGLMIAEVALSVVLLTGAGLLVRSFVQLLDVNPGFDTSRVLMLPIGLPSFAYPDAARQATFYDRAIDAARAIPGVEAVGAIDDLPLTGDRDANPIAIAGRPPQALNDLPVAQVRSVSPEYFRTMRIPLAAGRAFDARDASTSAAVVLINQTIARRLFPGEDPIGQRLTYGTATAQSQWLTIVGVVGDVRDLGLEEQADLEVYQPYPQATLSYMTLVARTTGSPAASIGVVRDAIHRLDPSLPLFEGQTMDSVVAFGLAPRRFNMLLLGVLAAIALVLAGVGIYGVIAYGVLRRRREIGIRIALGAQRRDVLTLVIGRGLRLTGIGIATGIAAALLLTRLLASLLFSVRPHDPLTIFAVAAVLVAVALLACYLPARRALRVDPTVTLRQE